MLRATRRGVADLQGWHDLALQLWPVYPSCLPVDNNDVINVIDQRLEVKPFDIIHTLSNPLYVHGFIPYPYV